LNQRCTDEEEEELEETEDLEQVIREQADKLQELIVDNRMLEREKQALQIERDRLDQELNQLHAKVGALTEELANCQEPMKTRTIVHPEAITLLVLQSAITPKTKGGSYAANNATGLKKLVEQALSLLEGKRSWPLIALGRAIKSQIVDCSVNNLTWSSEQIGFGV